MNPTEQDRHQLEKKAREQFTQSRNQFLNEQFANTGSRQHELAKLDVKTAKRNSELNEKIWMAGYKAGVENGRKAAEASAHRVAAGHEVDAQSDISSSGRAEAARIANHPLMPRGYTNIGSEIDDGEDEDQLELHVALTPGRHDGSDLDGRVYSSDDKDYSSANQLKLGKVTEQQMGREKESLLRKRPFESGNDTTTHKKTRSFKKAQRRTFSSEDGEIVSDSDEVSAAGYTDENLVDTETPKTPTRQPSLVDKRVVSSLLTSKGITTPVNKASPTKKVNKEPNSSLTPQTLNLAAVQAPPPSRGKTLTTQTHTSIHVPLDVPPQTERAKSARIRKQRDEREQAKAKQQQRSSEPTTDEESKIAPFATQHSVPKLKAKKFFGAK